MQYAAFLVQGYPLCARIPFGVQTHSTVRAQLNFALYTLTHTYKHYPLRIYRTRTFEYRIIATSSSRQYFAIISKYAMVAIWRNLYISEEYIGIQYYFYKPIHLIIWM